MADIVERLRQRPWRSAAENDYEAKERRQREREEGADEITALRAENERLRAALKAISEVKQSWGSESEEMYELARTALEGKQ